MPGMDDVSNGGLAKLGATVAWRSWEHGQVCPADTGKEGTVAILQELFQSPGGQFLDIVVRQHQAGERLGKLYSSSTKIAACFFTTRCHSGGVDRLARPVIASA
jgi:hypothetical protein